MSRPTPTLQRLERLLTMVPWLLDHPGATVDEVARRFGAEPEEVLSDLDTLGYCGLPGYGGGDLVEVSIMGDRIVVRMADFFRRPLRLSVREAVTLVLAARSLSGVAGAGESAALESASAKLESALGGGLAGARLEVDLGAPGDEHLPALRAAVAERRVVHLRYRSGAKAETTVRDVEPWALVAAHGAWYLQAWCRSARAPRDFRLDRMEALRPLPETVSGPPRRAAPPRYTPQPGDRRVVLDLAPEAWWLGEWVVADRVDDQGTARRVELRTPAFEWLARLVLRVAPHARVVDPPELADRVERLAAETLDRYAQA